MSEQPHKIGRALELLERRITNIETTRPAWVDEIMRQLEQLQTVAVETARDVKQIREHLMPQIDKHGEAIRSLEEEAFMRIGEHHHSNGNGNGNAE